MSEIVPAIDRVREQPRDLSGFDYTAAAELFPSRSPKSRRPTGYKRFATAAEAIRFAVEELPPPAMLGACLEVDETRFGRADIHRLYARAEFPLARRHDVQDVSA